MPDLNFLLDFSELQRMDDNMARLVEQELPPALESLMDSLGEILLNEAKEVFRTTIRPHARFQTTRHQITRGKNKGKIREQIGLKTTINTNSVDTGTLWNSLSRRGRMNHWQFNKASERLRLVVGSDVEYASDVHYDVTFTKRHWVPGVVDSNGIFRYQRGAKTGIMIHPHKRAGLFYFDIALEELKKVAPDKINETIERVFRNAGW